MVTEAIRTARTARAVGATGKILVRGDSVFGISAVVNACLRARVQFSVVLTKNPAGDPGDRRHRGGRLHRPSGHRPPDRAPGPRPHQAR
jgi:hypothetical protein